MATLAQMRSRVLSMEGHELSDETLVLLNVTDALNEAYRGLCHLQPWWFTMETDTVTAASGYLILDPDVIHVIDVFDSTGERIVQRTREIQIRLSDPISGSGLRTWAIDGVDGATNGLRLHLQPEITGTFTIRQAIMPVELAADADEPVGPSIVGDYLVWTARKSRLKEDEERQYLDASTGEQIGKYLAQLQKMHGMLTKEDGPFFAR